MMLSASISALPLDGELAIETVIGSSSMPVSLLRTAIETGVTVCVVALSSLATGV